MRSPLARSLPLIGAAAAVFAVAVAVGLKIIPPPHQDTDYLAIGSAATLLSLLALFGTLLATSLKTKDVLYSRRKVGESPNPPTPGDEPPPAGKSPSPDQTTQS
jgi:hypothetical protein